MIRKPILALAVAAALNPMGAFAVGLGDIQLGSALNEVLSAQISLHKVEEGELESLTVSLASAEAFAKAGLERPYYLTDLRFSTELGADGKPLIKVKSQNPIREPFLNFLVEVNWPKGKVMREFTLLLDPPTSFRRRPPVIQAAPSLAQPIPLAVKAAPPAFTQAPGEEYRVEANDTLWSIAKRYRPEGVSIQEMVMAIYRNNPQAFARNNMNLLLAGRTLSIPSQTALAGGNEQEARQAFKAQLAGGQAADEGSDLGLQASPEQRPTPIDARGDLVPPEKQVDRVEIVTAAEQKAAESQGGFEQNAMSRLEKDLMLARELNEKVNAENNELQGRLQRLESQLADLERLLRLKSDTAAQVQGQLGDAPEQEAVAAVEPPPAEEPAQEQAQEQAPAEIEAEAKPAEEVYTPPAEQTAQPESETKPEAKPESTPEPAAEPASAQQPEPKPAAKPAPAAEPELAQEPGLLDMLFANPLLLGGGLGAILLLLILLLLKAKRGGTAKKDQEALEAVGLTDTEQAPSYEDVLDKDTDLSTIESEEEDAPQSSLLLDFTPSELEGLGADTEVDPVSEADVYVAYGRLNQAIDLLREGMERNPERSDIKIKLLEVLHAAGNKDEFLRSATEFSNQGLARMNPAGWARVAVLGKQIDAEHPLFSGTPTAEADEQSPDALSDLQPELEAAEPSIEAMPVAEAAEASFELELASETETSLDEEISLAPVAEVEAESELADELINLDDLEIPEIELDTYANIEPEIESKIELEPDLEADLDIQGLEASALSEPLEHQVGLDEEEILGQDIESAESLEPVIDLSSKEDQEALQAIEALTGINEDDLELGEGMFSAASDASLDELEAELAKAAEAPDAKSAKPSKPASVEELELEDSLAELDQSLEADSADIDLESELADLDLDLSVDTSDVDLESELADLDKELGVGGGLDDLDLDQELAGVGEPMAAAKGLGEMDLLADEDEEDQLQTKLELAEAYVDMGDPDGGRSILEEVLAEGTAEQKAKAQDILAKLA
ncbi:MAG: LysM peptidoglycan-binding domain-containing protein [Gammaproteobacteria bacterium]|nr:LysM peptidoglycan-binding domain-containing protein [Gammaproteobacteria bacterium]